MIDDICKNVECGKGSCKAADGSGIDYVCECEPGWLQPRPSRDDLNFLPCVIPNCTLDFSCIEPPSPPREPGTYNLSLDVCQWAECGSGTCKKTSELTYECECNEGYFNLLDRIAFPCYKKCAHEKDCSAPGIDATNTSSSPPSLPDNSSSRASSTSIHYLYWKILISLASLAFALVKRDYV